LICSILFKINQKLETLESTKIWIYLFYFSFYKKPPFFVYKIYKSDYNYYFSISN
jgi:hypothetical protein